MTAALAGAAGVLVVLLARPRARRRLDRGTDSRRAGVLVAVVGATVLCAAAGVAAHTIAAAAVAATAVRVALVRSARSRARAQRRREVVMLGHAVAAELRAGRAPADALAAVAGQLPQIGPDLESVAAAVRGGADLDVELHRVAAAAGAERLAVLAAAWAVGVTTGARVADVLEHAATAFEADDAHADELSAIAAGPRATTVLLALLPVAGLVLGSALGTSSWRLLTHTRLGLVLLTAAAALDGVGLLWLRRLTAAAV